MSGLHLIVGCMFSGKSSELLKLIHNYNRMKIPICVASHTLDKRYGENHIISHSGKKYPCFQLNKLMTLLDEDTFKKSKAVFVEEGQFFEDLMEFYETCMSQKKHLYIAALNGDFEQNGMGHIDKLYSKCDSIKKLNAYCGVCLNNGIQRDAIFTKRIVESKEVILVDSAESYIPVCREHLK